MRIDNIEPSDIARSLKLEENITNVFKAGEGAGQSGSFFFYSKDRKFIIKTMRGNERKNMTNMVDDLVEYLINDNPESLISRIYGIFTLKTNAFAEVDFFIMQNVNQMISKANKKMVFDIKGNTRKRMLKIDKEHKQFWLNKDHTFKGVLRDLNFNQINKDLGNKMVNLKWYLSPVINDIIDKDSKFLASHGLIDYSLLLTCEQVRSRQKVRETNNRKLSVDGKTVIHLGIIDYLQEYNCMKYMEMKWRTLGKTKGEAYDYSTVLPADEYGERFAKYIKSKIFKNHLMVSGKMGFAE